MKFKNSSAGFAFVAVIIIAAVVAAAGGGVYYAAKQSSSADVNANATTTTEVNASTDTETSGSTTASSSASVNVNANVNVDATTSLRKLIGAGKSTVCTFDHTVSNSQSSGTVYISSTGEMRGDFTSKTSSGTVDSHMITTGGNVYVWSGAMAGQGMKMPINNTQANAQSNTAVNLDDNLSYNCKSWSADKSKFTLPSTVQFTDLSAMMQGQLNGNVKIPAY